MTTPKEQSEMVKVSKMKIDGLEQFIERYDWGGIARAFQEGNIRWHKEEWQEFIEKIVSHTRREDIEIVKGMNVGMLLFDPMNMANKVDAIATARAQGHNKALSTLESKLDALNQEKK